MSRGYGWVQRRVLECLDSSCEPQTTASIASWVYGGEQSPAHPTIARGSPLAEIAAVKRALRGLERNGEPIGRLVVSYRGIRRTYWARNEVWDQPIAEPAPVRAKLVKLLGMMASEFEGERANAALMAERLRRGIGLTWDQLLAEGIDAYAA
jgi:hypothetical protein